MWQVGTVLLYSWYRLNCCNAPVKFDLNGITYIKQFRAKMYKINKIVIIC